MGYSLQGIVASGIFALAGGAVQAEQALLSTLLEPNHPITIEMHQKWAEGVAKATNGDVTFELFVGASLLPAVSQMRGTADGVAQVALHGTPYTPSELPVSNALGDIGFRVADELVLALAFTDFMTHEDVGYQDWRKNGVIFGAGFSNPSYHYLCRENLSTLADMRGKKVRTNGSGWARFSESIGMVPVNIPSSEIYTGMERGALDCACVDVTHLISGSTIMDLTKSIVMLPLSPAYSTPGLIYNPTWWQGLTDDQRRIIFDESARAIARLQIAFAARVEEAIAKGRENGVAINEPGADLSAALDEWVADGIGGMEDVARDVYGIDDPAALYASFQTYIDKWVGLLDGFDRTNEDALTQLIKVNLYDTLDASTYGMDG